MSASSCTTNNEWKQLDPESLVSAKCLIEQTLCQPNDDQPQLAKDFNYASAVLDAWKQQEEEDSDKVWMTETMPIVYHDEQDNPLYGHLVRRPGKTDSTIPGVVLFHTGAGPHDLFLLWKAAALVNADEYLSHGCVVLIADILSDDTGWGWSPDRNKYNQVMKQVLTNDNSQRPMLQQRIRAAIDTLVDQDNVDSNRLSALGWCLGGHAILELGRMNVSGMRAMATFHGVFDELPISIQEDTENENRSEILICHGTKDPFVSDAALENALATFQHHRHLASLLQLQGAKHGFSNPAQDFNENEAFGFNQEAAHKAWRQTLALLKRTCS